PPRLSPVRRARAAARWPRRLPQGARDRHGHPLSGAEPPAARGGAFGSAPARAHRAVRAGDPHPAPLGGAPRLRDRGGDRRGARLPRGVSAPLRILQLYPKADYFTGAAIQLRDLAWGLRARGHAVVVGTRPSAVWAEQCAAADIPHAAIPMRSEVDLP